MSPIRRSLIWIILGTALGGGLIWNLTGREKHQDSPSGYSTGNLGPNSTTGSYWTMLHEVEVDETTHVLQHLTDEIQWVNDTLVRVQSGDDFVGLYHVRTGQLVHQFSLDGISLDSLKKTYPVQESEEVVPGVSMNNMPFRPFRIHRAEYLREQGKFQLIMSVLNPYQSGKPLLANYDYFSVFTDHELVIERIVPNNFNAEMAYHNRLRTMGQGFHLFNNQYYTCYERSGPDGTEALFRQREVPPLQSATADQKEYANSTLAVYSTWNEALVFERELNVPYPIELQELSAGKDYTVLYPRFFREGGDGLYFTNSKRLFRVSEPFTAFDILQDREEEIMLNFNWMKGPDHYLAVEIERGQFDQSPQSFLVVMDSKSHNWLAEFHLGNSLDVSGLDFTSNKAVILIREGDHYLLRTYAFQIPVS